MKRNNILAFALLLTITAIGTLAAQTTVKVIDFSPAPGQFVNVLPTADSTDTPASIILKAEQLINNQSPISLGGFGGSVTLYYTDGIPNLNNQTDFRVLGNAFPNNAEPGVIYISKDNNHNGLPDDEWFEIAGSEHQNTLTNRNYTITYHKPTTEKEAQSGIVADYLPWTDSNNQSGYIGKTRFHQQCYWPLWNHSDSMTITSTLLPNNTCDKKGDGSYITFDSFAWGYADNQSNTDEASKIDIDWAIDSLRASVQLDSIHFIKVMTAENLFFNNTGEISTEVAGLELCSLQTAISETAQSNNFCYLYKQNIYCYTENNSTLQLWTINGQLVKTIPCRPGEQIVETNTLTAGIYIIKLITNGQCQIQKIAIS